MIVNEIVTQHHRRPFTQISHKPVILRYTLDGFGSFWLGLLVVVGGFGCMVPCFGNYPLNSYFHIKRFQPELLVALGASGLKFGNILLKI